jgi:hypothetical protein
MGDEEMNYTISVAVRITVVAIMLLGLFFFVLLGLLAIARELIANEHHQAPALTDKDPRTYGSRRSPATAPSMNEQAVSGTCNPIHPRP